MNLRGQLGDQLVFFAFIFLMGLVGGGIVIGTLVFVGEGNDFRASDAGLFGDKIEKCVNNGFELNSLKEIGDSDMAMTLLSEKCGLNKEVLEKYRIKICESSKVSSGGECVASDDFVFRFGDVMPCEFTDSNDFLGCSNRIVGSYVIVTATNQEIRRNLK